MKRFSRQQGEQVVDIGNEPIDRELKECLLTELYSHPGSRVIRRNGHLWFKSGRFEILAERLCELKRRWVQMVEHAPMSDDDKFKIFALLMARDDARLEQVPGLGLKVTLPPRTRH